MSQDIETLIEMGFTREKSERALAVTNNKGVEPAMEWLLAHAGEAEAAPPASAASHPSPSEPTTSSSQPATSTGSADVAKSLKCDDCNKLFRSQAEVEFHAAKSGHSNFSESTEEKKPLTEEEKKEMLVKLEERMKEKRKEREDKEKSEQLERERLRIKSGKDMQDAKQRLQEQEMQKIVEQRKRDKMEDQKARDRVRQQIQADKEARRLAAHNKEPNQVAQSAASAPPPVAAAPPAAAPPAAAPTSARLQLRLPDGRALTQTFGAREQLSAVRLYLQINEMKDRPFGLMTTFPRRVFIEEDYDKPLDALGLAPSAVVIVSKPQMV